MLSTPELLQFNSCVRLLSLVHAPAGLPEATNTASLALAAHMEQDGQAQRPGKEEDITMACMKLLCSIVNTLANPSSPLFLHSNISCLYPAIAICAQAAERTCHTSKDLLQVVHND